MPLRAVSSIAAPSERYGVDLTAKVIAVTTAGTVELFGGSTRIGAARRWRISAIDGETSRAVVELPMSERGGKAAWAVELWDLAANKKLARLADCAPDDKLGPTALTPQGAFAIRATRPAWSLVRFDAKGKPAGTPTKLATKVVPFHLAVGGDLAAWTYFDSAVAGVVDLATGAQKPLAGGALRIGRQHHKGVSRFTASPGIVVASSSGAGRTVVWSAATRKAVAGPWSDAPSAIAVGDRVVWWTDGSELRTTEHAMATGGPGKVAAAGDGRHVAWANAKGVEVWDVIAGKRVGKLARKGELVSLACSGGRVAAGGTDRIEIASF